MAVLVLNEPGFVATFTSTVPISILESVIPGFLQAMHTLDDDLEAASLTLTPATPPLYTYALTLGDARFYYANVNPLDGTRAILSSPFTLPELLSHNPVIELLFGLLDMTITNISVVWA